MALQDQVSLAASLAVGARDPSALPPCAARAEYVDSQLRARLSD